MSESDQEPTQTVEDKKQIRQDKKDRSAMKERYSYIVLAVIILLVCIISVAFTINYVNRNNRAWCEIINASLPVKPPTLPTNANEKGYADKVKQYTDYFIVVRLGKHFGCL
jgi:hypothetical protein